jgi:phosphoribosylformylglycinamidine cyclo-ligase
MGKNVPERVAKIVSGVAAGCVQAGCALIGGESAEMPGFYPEDEYDLAGFSVGIVDREKITDINTQKSGDVIIALKSSGLHSNGFSLVRKVFAVNEQNLLRHYSEIGGSLGDILIRPTKIYVKPMTALMSEITVRGVANITGGGFYENIPRAVKNGLTAEIEKAKVQVLPVFNLLADTGKIPERDMFNTFNMGVGMITVVSPEDADKALKILAENGEDAYVIGKLTDGDEKIKLI